MRYLVLALSVLVVAACNKDDEIDPVSGDRAIHYDGSNQSAPAIARGISYAAVRFPAAEVLASGATGKSLTGVDFHVTDRPSQIKVIVFSWNDQDDREPGNVLYEQVLSRSTISGGAWNHHSFGRSISIPAEGFWIACEVDAGDNDLRVIGCDQGPRHPQGDVYGVFGDNLPGWTSLYDFSSQAVDVNWNLRGVIE